MRGSEVVLSNPGAQPRTELTASLTAVQWHNRFSISITPCDRAVFSAVEIVSTNILADGDPHRFVPFSSTRSAVRGYIGFAETDDRTYAPCSQVFTYLHSLACLSAVAEPSHNTIGSPHRESVMFVQHQPQSDYQLTAIVACRPKAKSIPF
jgi:hypothetical protein